ncbi:hypothetical protein T12_14259 [Trichinella patagoniensis]|uniref:Uncharacterized protein n=1 Tax=Trichinella patagoniensis TaxID=990121 RepID=A0A0V0YRP7_9BILA|nr:hypothetical protein T12_14259 [Trichinella patagoniensis]
MDTEIDSVINNTGVSGSKLMKQERELPCALFLIVPLGLPPLGPTSVPIRSHCSFIGR